MQFIGWLCLFALICSILLIKSTNSDHTTTPLLNIQQQVVKNEKSKSLLHIPTILNKTSTGGTHHKIDYTFLRNGETLLTTKTPILCATTTTCLCNEAKTSIHPVTYLLATRIPTTEAAGPWHSGVFYIYLLPTLFDWMLLNAHRPSSEGVMFPLTANSAVLFGHKDTPQTIFVAMSLVPYFVKRILPLLTTPVVVISANNDYTVPVNIDTRYDSKEVLRVFAPAWDVMVSHPMVVHWFVENRVELHPKVSTMPVGMNPKEGHPDDRSDHPSPDSLLPLDMKPLKMLQIDRIRNGTQWENRRAAHMWCEQHTEICHSGGQLTNHKEFVREVASYPFLLCVHGGGLDPSPKAWEAVLLGTIPIVESGPLDDAYRLLPVALVRNMTEFLQQDEEDVKEMMERWIDELGPHYVEGSKERSEALRRLTTRFWYDQIMSHVPENT